MTDTRHCFNSHIITGISMSRFTEVDKVIITLRHYYAVFIATPLITPRRYAITPPTHCQPLRHATPSANIHATTPTIRQPIIITTPFRLIQCRIILHYNALMLPLIPTSSE